MGGVGFGLWWCLGWGFGGGDLFRNLFGDLFGDSFYGGYEAVAAAGEGFDEAWVGGGVAEGFADAVDGGVDAVFVVDEGAVGPELAGDLFAGEEVAGPLEEQAEDLEGLGVELDADALLAELSGGGVGFEDSEAIALRWGLRRHVLGQFIR